MVHDKRAQEGEENTSGFPLETAATTASSSAAALEIAAVIVVAAASLAEVVAVLEALEALL